MTSPAFSIRTGLAAPESVGNLEVNSFTRYLVQGIDFSIYFFAHYPFKSERKNQQSNERHGYSPKRWEFM